MKSTKKFLCGYTSIFLLTLLLSSCSSEGKNILEERVVSVKTQTINYGNYASVKSFVGTAEGDVTSSLSFQTIGNIDRIYVAEGDFVKKGQMLAEVNKENLIALNKSAQATLTQAKDAAGRIQQLYDNHSIPEIKYIDIQTKLEQAESAAEIAQKNLNNAILRAPFDGVIGKCNVEAGEAAIPGMSAFIIMKMARVKIKFSVPENEIALIKKGTKATITVPALSDRVFSGSVTEKGISANPLSHTYEARISLSNSLMEILPGMVCNVTISLYGESNNSIVIPSNIVQIDANDQRFVWIADGGKATKRIIVTGGLTDNGIIVKSGLSDNDRIIVSGANKVSEGTKIKYNE